MIPKKLIIVCIINLLLSLVWITLGIFLILGSITIPFFQIFKVLGGIVAGGGVLSLIGNIMILVGHKVGMYLYMFSWIPTFPSLSNPVGWVLYGWMYFSMYMIKEDDVSRSYLQLTDSFWERKRYKKNHTKLVDRATPIKTDAKTYDDPILKYINECRLQGFDNGLIQEQLHMAGHDRTEYMQYF